MDIAVFGTRTLGDFSAVDDLILSLPTDDSVRLLVDGKLGVSNYAKNKASFQMIPIKHYPANFKQYGQAAESIRNHRIVDDADEVHVFYNKLDEILKDIIEYTSKLGKPIYTYEIPGELITEL
jgi:hypothetical protein